MDCSPGIGTGGGGASGSACAQGAASVSAAIAASVPVATDSAIALSDFLTDTPFAFFTVPLNASVLVPRLLHLCNV
jgi:hypothetical protein